MSATPRIYELENKEDIPIENILGESLYNIDFKEAIKNKYITDYNIYFPIINENFQELVEDIRLNIEFTEDELFKKCCYLYECIRQFGKIKCIIYFQNVKEINKFIAMFNNLNEYYTYSYYIDIITYKDSKKQRQNKLNKFKDSEKISLLCSVSILDECIDIPSCDTIYITYNCTSKIKNIQRVSRAMRITKNNIHKKARICAWLSSPMLLSSIKEMDSDFEDKIIYVDITKNGTLSSQKELLNKNYKETHNFKAIQAYKYNTNNWDMMYDKLEQFITINNKLPTKNENELWTWYNNNMNRYKKTNRIFKDIHIKEKWKQFIIKNKNKIKTKEEKIEDKINEIKQFIKDNDRLPKRSDINEIKLRKWYDKNKKYF